MNSWNPGMANFSGAGGFVQDPNIFDSPSSTKKVVRKLQNVVPIFIRHVKNQNNDEFKLFGSPVQIVSIVGMIKEMEIQSTCATYKVADISGSIKAVFWIDVNADDDLSKLSNSKEGSYVEIFGTVRRQNGEKIIMILKMIPIENCNIITTHYINVMHTILQGETISNNFHSTVKRNNPGAQLANSMSFYDESKSENKQLPFTPFQNKLFKIFESDNTISGLDRSAILSKFPSDQKNEVNAALEFLVSEGHIYSTIDSEHFKATDA